MANSTEIWSDEIGSYDECQSNECDSADTSKISALLKLYTFFLLTLQTLFRLSDTAINVLLAVCQLFLNLSFQSFQQHAACSYRASGGTFIQDVCCPSCHSLYQWKECIIHLPDNQLVSKHCSFQRFPNHPQHQHRHGCGQSLMKIKSSKGKQSLYPRLIYCYKSVIASLQEMVSKPGFIDKCELWCERKAPQGVYRSL